MGYRCYLPVLAGLAPVTCMEPGRLGYEYPTESASGKLKDR
jgi:hypothetical protein